MDGQPFYRKRADERALRSMEGTNTTNLVEVHLLPVPMLNKPIQVLQHKRPRLVR